MADPNHDDRDDALLRRLYDEPDADGADGELAREVESFRRVRGAIADYARATEVEPPSRGLDELLAAARSRAPARAAVAPESTGMWARLRGWFQPIAAHPALASVAMVAIVAVIGGVLYTRGTANVADQEVAGPAAREAESQQVAAPGGVPATPTDDDFGVVARLEDGSGSGSAANVNQTTAPGSGDDGDRSRDKGNKPRGDKPRPGKPAPTGTLAVKPDPGSTAKGNKLDRPVAEPDGLGPAGGVALGEGVVVTDGNDGRVAPPPVLVPSTPSPTSTGTTGTGRQPEKPAIKAEETTKDTGGDAAPEPVDETESTPPKKSGTDVQQLTRQARTAAKSGDCAVVKSIGGRVKKANASYYKQTFVTDADIKKCL